MKKISEVEARHAVLKHIEGFDLNGWRYALAELRYSEIDKTWIALFDTYHPDGARFDGPVCFVIDKFGVHGGPTGL
ncbi:hypothetical protein GGR44_003297 [Sphingobium fontiphilum]|uniref:SnoaL-like domain-containing protein n=1 Tax=Sphingobium fontiphilum TaxID=944425 RepID=A0A7W6DHZ2_9SPHN|nr:hypothetical protein [Sphingobium fontiphilum]MBB3983601.1 hypothetical protein [Sphingobium fontiphilum]